MICKYCGFEVPDGQNFCPNCGNSMKADEDPFASVRYDESDHPGVSLTGEERPADRESAGAPIAAATAASPGTAADPDVLPDVPKEPEPVYEAPEQPSPQGFPDIPDRPDGDPSIGLAPGPVPSAAAEAVKADIEKEPVPVEKPGKEPKPEKEPKPQKEPKPKKNELFSHLQIERDYLLIYVIGGVFLGLFTYMVVLSAAASGVEYVAAASIISGPVSTVNLIIFGVSLIAMMVSHTITKQTAANIVTMIGVILAILIEIVVIVCCLGFPEAVMTIYTRDTAIVSVGSRLLLAGGIGALIATIAAGVLGFMFHWKHFWIYILCEAGALVIAAGLMFLGVFALKSPVLIGFSIGLLQGCVSLLPAIGFNVLGGRTLERAE